jgi:flagellar hook-associated protein 1 FlgK
MAFRTETLDKTQNQIGQLAISLAVGFNEQHRLGVDLNGELGEDFFSIGQPQAYAYERNGGTAEVASASFDTANIDQLRATDYTVRFTDSGPQVIRKDNGQPLPADEVSWVDNELSFGGITLTFDGAPIAGDRFEVQPVRRAAAGMETRLSDLDKIAAGDAGFVDGGSTLNSFKSSGDLDVSDLGITPVAFAGSKEYQFEVDSDGNLTVTPPGATIRVNGNSFDPSTEVLTDEDTVTVDGISFTLGELPAEDETATLTVTQNIIAATGDNRNALALQNLQSEALVAGRASFSQAYAGMISDVGNQTNIVQVNLDARQGLTDQLKAVQQSESGVNLDEEAANLLRYQQFYAANARVIDTASTIFDTILGLRS